MRSEAICRCFLRWNVNMEIKEYSETISEKFIVEGPVSYTCSLFTVPKVANQQRKKKRVSDLVHTHLL